MRDDVKCWNCSISYLRGLTHCPPPFGCGKPAKFVDEMGDIIAAEKDVAKLIGDLARLYNRARTSGSTGLMFATSRARNHARQALEATARLRDALRNDGGGDDDDDKGAA